MRSRWFNPRAIGLHITALVLIPTFLLLGRWQLERALHGNFLSWAYTFEWPLFAIYGTYMWWKLVHDIADDQAIDSVPDQPASPELADTDTADEELIAYNAYLASLRADDERQKQRPPK